MDSLTKIKFPKDPYYTLKETPFFKFLALNDYLNSNPSGLKLERFSKETVFQKFMGFFEYVTSKSLYLETEFIKYISEINFKHKASFQKQKNFISLLIESLESWSLESAEVELIKDFLMMENKEPRLFGFYVKSRKAIINHCTLSSQTQKKYFFLDDLDLDFVKLLKYSLDEYMKGRFSNPNSKYLEVFHEGSPYKAETTIISQNNVSFLNEKPQERKQTSIECKTFKEIKKKDQNVFWEMIEILLENYKEMWESYKESFGIISSVLNSNELKQKFQVQLTKLKDSFEGFELKYNINGFLEKIDNILMSKYQIDKISSENQKLFSEDTTNNNTKSNIPSLPRAKTIAFEKIEEKNESSKSCKYHKLSSVILSNESRESPNFGIMKDKYNGFVLPMSVKELEITEETDVKDI